MDIVSIDTVTQIITNEVFNEIWLIDYPTQRTWPVLDLLHLRLHWILLQNNQLTLESTQLDTAAAAVWEEEQR